MHHIFFIATGFHYFFAKQIIAQKNIQNPIIVICFIHEHALCAAIQKNHPHVFDISWTTDVKPWHARKNAIEKAIAEIACRLFKTNRRGVHLYKDRYGDFKILKRAFKNQKPIFNLFPDGVNLLHNLPVVAQGDKKYLRFLWQKIRFKLKNPHFSLKHINGSYSKFIDKIYHFPVADDVPIYAPREKIEWLEIEKPKNPKRMDAILFIGSRFSHRALDWMRKNYPGKIIYRPHPGGLTELRERKIQKARNAGFEILDDLNIPLEEYILQNHFAQIFGSFSTALIIAHLFCPETEAVFLYDEKIGKDRNWRPVAEAVGLKIVDI